MSDKLKNEKGWEDQPDAVLAFPVVMCLRTTQVIEVRAGERPEEPHVSREYLVTIGNLFGSQTLRAWGEDKLFEVIRIATSDKRTADLPSNVEVVK